MPMVKPKETVYRVDFSEPNALTELELAKIRAKFHIPGSMVMRILGLLESLSDPDGGCDFLYRCFQT